MCQPGRHRPCACEKGQRQIGQLPRRQGMDRESDSSCRNLQDETGNAVAAMDSKLPSGKRDTFAHVEVVSWQQYVSRNHVSILQPELIPFYMCCLNNDPYVIQECWSARSYGLI
jgi:hypothetical protein